MPKATTFSHDDDKAPSTPEEKAAAAEYGKKLDAELGLDKGEEDNAEESQEKEPAEKLDSEKEPEQEQETPEEVSEEKAKESEQDLEEKLSPKELRYKEQLLGEKKSNQALQAKLQALETQISKLTPAQQKELTPEEQQIIQEKQYLKEKYGMVAKEDVEALEAKLQSLVDGRFKPIQKKREDAILQGIYKKFPDISPDKDPTNEKWVKVTGLLSRFMPANSLDPLDDYEERFEWAYEKAFGRKANYAQLRQNSYTGVGGGSSAAKSKTVTSTDKYAHLSPEARAYKAQLDAITEEEDKREELRRKK